MITMIYIIDKSYKAHQYKSTILDWLENNLATIGSVKIQYWNIYIRIVTTYSWLDHFKYEYKKNKP